MVMMMMMNNGDDDINDVDDDDDDDEDDDNVDHDGDDDDPISIGVCRSESLHMHFVCVDTLVYDPLKKNSVISRCFPVFLG